MKETPYQSRCIAWVRDTYKGRLLIVNIHGGGYSNKGFPDLLVFGGGHAVAVELKGESGYKLQPDQRIWRKRFLRSGTPHYVIIDDFDAFKRMIREEFPDETCQEVP